MASSSPDLDLLSDLIAKARKSGADAADAVMVDSTSLSAAWRVGANEGIERSESHDVGLRVLIGKRQAVVSSTDMGSEALAELVERAVAMARSVPEDPYCGLADQDRLSTDIPDLDLADPVEPSPEHLFEAAAAAEDAARAVDGITNSEGAESSWGRGATALVSSHGFAARYDRTSFGTSVSVVAGSGTGMERDYDYTAARHAADLESPQVIGGRAAERAVRRLNPRKVKSCQVPVVFDPRVSGGFLGLLSATISGTAIARGTSFLKKRLGEVIFADTIDVIDDPFRKRGLASRPFDGEGVAPERRKIIDQGRLTTWLLDSRSARRLGMETTGHAARSISAPPSPAPSNLHMAPGPLTPEALIGEIKNGFYITEMMGMSFNNVTGDYSRGAAGFWIENGEITFSVSEVTVAGNLNEVFREMTPASDLEFKYGVNVPTLRVDGMTIAGL